MALIRWDPWRELEQLRAETDRMWDQFLAKFIDDEDIAESVAFVPDVDLVESPSEYRVYVCMPGVLEEDVDILVSDSFVTIRGERHSPYDAAHSRRRVGEWRYGYFQRRIQLPQAVDPASIRAAFDAGVLTIVIPKC